MFEKSARAINSDPIERIRNLYTILAAHRYSWQTEDDLQLAIEELLAVTTPYRREVRLSLSDRIDFLVDGLGIELKVGGSLAEVTRQLHRYAQSDLILGLILVTTRSRHRVLPCEINGKPLLVHWLGGIF